MASRPVYDSSIVVPVSEAEPIVGDLRNHYDRTAPLGFPAHITLFYPFFPPDEITDEIRADVGAVLAQADSFSFRLAGVCGFRNIVWLAPDPSTPFLALSKTLRQMYPDFAPYGDPSRGTVPPHLTVARSDDVSFLASVARSLADALPITAQVVEAVLLVEAEPLWKVDSTLPLGGLAGSAGA